MYTQNQMILLRGRIQHTIMSHIGDQYSEAVYRAMCDEVFCDDLVMRVGDAYLLSQNLRVNGHFDFDAFSNILSENLRLTVKAYIQNENARSNIYMELPAVVRDIIEDIKEVLNL